MLVNNVVKMDNNKINEQIKMFLDDKFYLSESEQTVKEYERDIREFFKYLRNKDIEYLTIDDIQLSEDEPRKFRSYLYNDKKLSNSSINRKFSAIKGLYERFYNRKLVNDISMLNEIKSLKINDNQHGHLSIDEVLKMANLIMTKPGVRKRKTKYYLILFALDTCLRKSALLNLKWSDFEVQEDGVLVKAVDKGKKDYHVKIAKSFYDELLEIKNGSEYVFDISEDAIQTMMNQLKEWMNIPKERNIVFHSIRKAGVAFQYKMTGDIIQAQKAANHTNITTTQRYVKKEDYGIVGAVSSGGKVDDRLFEKVSHEELIKAIQSLPKNYKLMLNMKLNEIILKEK